MWTVSRCIKRIMNSASISKLAGDTEAMRRSSRGVVFVNAWLRMVVATTNFLLKQEALWTEQSHRGY